MHPPGFDSTWRTRSRDSTLWYQVGGDLLVAIGYEETTISVLRAATGEQLWTKPAGHMGIKPWRNLLPVEMETPSGTHVFELSNAETGASECSLPLEGRIGAGGVCSDYAVLAYYRQAGAIAYSLREHEIVWRRNLSADLTQLRAQHRTDDARMIVEIDDELFGVLWGGMLYGCALADGRPLWATEVAASSHYPNVHQGRMHMLQYDRYVTLDAKSGRTLVDRRHRELHDAYLMGPGAVHFDWIAFACESGHLVVIRRDDGELLDVYRHGAPLWHVALADDFLLTTTRTGELLVFQMS